MHYSRYFKKGLLSSLILSLSVLCLTGCYKRYTDANDSIKLYKRYLDPEKTVFERLKPIKPDHSLYCKGGGKARLKMETHCFAKAEYGARVYWEPEKKQALFEQRFYPFDISSKCRNYVEDESGKQIPAVDIDSFFAGGAPGSDTLVVSERFKEAIKSGFLVPKKIDKKYWIICVEPLVAISLDMDNVSWNRIFSYLEYGRPENARGLSVRKWNGEFCEYNYLENRFAKGNVVASRNIVALGSGIVLPYGLDYGLQMPYVENPRWFSPDLKIKEQPVEMIADNKGRIEVPWGYLHLAKKDDNWVVTAEPFLKQ